MIDLDFEFRQFLFPLLEDGWFLFHVSGYRVLSFHKRAPSAGMKSEVVSTELRKRETSWFCKFCIRINFLLPINRRWQLAFCVLFDPTGTPANVPSTNCTQVYANESKVIEASESCARNRCRTRRGTLALSSVLPAFEGAPFATLSNRIDKHSLSLSLSTNGWIHACIELIASRPISLSIHYMAWPTFLP